MRRQAECASVNNTTFLYLYSAGEGIAWKLYNLLFFDTGIMFFTCIVLSSVTIDCYCNRHTIVKGVPNNFIILSPVIKDQIKVFSTQISKKKFFCFFFVYRFVYESNKS